jgi:hypothetical protein
MIKSVRTRPIKNEKRNAYKILVRKLDGKRLLGKPKRRWVNIAECGEIGWGGMN